MKHSRLAWKVKTSLLLNIALFILSSQALLAQTYYVSTSGNNNNNGSQGSPWRNIWKAMDQAQTGDTVYLRAGTYTEADPDDSTSLVLIARSGITIAGFTGETAILDGNSLSAHNGVNLQSFKNITIQNLTIRNVRDFGVVGVSDNDNITLKNLSITGIYGSDSAVIKFQAGMSRPDPFPANAALIASGLTLENITASGNVSAGFDFGPGAIQNVIVRDVQLTGPGSGNNTAVDGIAVEQGQTVLVERAVVSGYPGDGIDLKADNATVRQCDVRNQSRNGVKLWGTNAVLENSVVVDNGDTSLVIERGPTRITNNTIGNTQLRNYMAILGSYDDPVSTQITLTNNFLFNRVASNDGVLVYIPHLTSMTAEGNVFYQPYRTDSVIADNHTGSEQDYGVTEFTAGQWPSGFSNNRYEETAGVPYTIGKAVLQDIWVDPVSGNDSNNGSTRALALRTLSAAWNRIPMGTTLSTTGYRIRLVSGTYSSSISPSYWESRYGTYRFPIILEAADGPGTVTLPGINMFDCRYLYMIGVRVQAGGGDVLHFDHCNHILFRQSVMTGSISGVQEGLKANQCQYIYVEDSDLSQAGENAVDFVACQYGHVIRNKIHHSESWCMYLKGGSANILVDGNEIYNCGGAGSDGGFLAGQSTGFEYMVSPWLHYEAYDIKFTNNFIHDTSGAGMGVNGGYNILLAYNTLYRIGSFSQLLDVTQGSRTCDGDSAGCQSRRTLGGWGPLISQAEQPIPNKNVFIYNNIFYNPSGFQSQWQHFEISGPRTPSSGTNIANPARSDVNLQIRGNIIWNGPTNHPLGLGASTGCQSSNTTCNETQIRTDNAINTIQPQLDGNQRPAVSSNVQSAVTYAIPVFPGNDRPSPPTIPQGNLFNKVTIDKDGIYRSALTPPGAYFSAGSSSTPSVNLSANPSSRTITAGGNTSYDITINRINFTGSVDLSVSGLPANVTASFSPDPTTGNTSTLTVNSTTSAATGTVNLTVGAAATGVTISSISVGLTINPVVSAPTITSFSPTSGVIGSSVTITGTNFTGATAVSLNNVAATFTVNSAIQITATVPSGAATGAIRVTTSGGTATSSSNFTVTTPPTPAITSFSPTSGVIGNSVTITGTNFTGATAVSLNNVAATFTVNSATQITATVPSGATTGAIRVTTAGGTALSSTNFTINSTPPSSGILPVVDAAMKANLRTIYLNGQSLNNHANVFAKIGDSITESGSFLWDIGCGSEDLGTNTNLAATIDYFRAFQFPSNYSPAWCGFANSFNRASVSAVTGWSADYAIAPASGLPSACSGADNTPVRCEMKLLQPSIAVIMYGTNDLERYNDLTLFRNSMNQIVTDIINKGVIPVLSTIPPRLDSTTLGNRVASYNQAIIDIANTRQIPLLNFWQALQDTNMINQGISEDGVHPNILNGSDGAILTAQGIRYGYNMRNLITVQALKKIKEIVIDNGTPDAGGGTSPSVTLSSTPNSRSINAGSGTTYTININRSNFSGSVDLSVSGLPSGVTGSFSPDPTTGTTSTLTINSNSSAAIGTVNLTVGATGNGVTIFPITLSLTVNAVVSIPTITSFTPSSGRAGNSVTIMGSNFTGATAVSFNNVTTSFTVNSATQITAAVPSGATTGAIRVTTAGGTAVSGSNFTVLGGAYNANTTHDNIPMDFTVAKPAAGTTIIDAKFQNPLMRIAKPAGRSSEAIVPEYAKRQAFNADESLLMLRSSQGAILIYDANTYQFIKALNDYTVGTQDDFWHPTNPRLIYFNSESALKLYNIDTDQISTVYSFKQRNGSPCAYADTLGEGNMSRDGKYYAVACRSNDSVVDGLEVIQLTSDTSAVSFKKLLMSGVHDIDWVTISPDGNYVLLDGGILDQTVRVYDRNLNELWRKVVGFGHSDIGYDTDGSNVLVMDFYTDYYGPNHSDPQLLFKKYRLSDGQETVLLAMRDTDSHTSCRNFNKPGWCYISTFVDYADQTTSTSNWFPFADEIFAVKMDGSGCMWNDSQNQCTANTGGVERLAHHHARRTTGPYEAEPHATVSVNGDRIIFASNWRQNISSLASIDAYVLDLRGSTATPAVILSSNPASRTITAGSGTTYTININRNNFSGSVDLSVSGLPSGVTASFNPDPTTGTSSTLTINSTSAAAIGTVNLTIGATGSGVTISSITVSLTVNAAVPTIANFSPSSGTAGSAVIISGTNFTGATSVSFNNVTSAFTVNSATQITATVPNGTSTGAIRVATAGGTAISSSNFTVTIPDTDLDGLNDQQEAQLGTNPLDSDSDDDGYNDGQEVGAGVNPLSAESYPGTLKITADNQYIIYVNGVQIGTNSNWSDVESYLVNTDEELNIGIEATDLGGIAALACQITHGTDKQLSDFTWQVSNILITNWQSETTDHSTWVNATEHYAMGQGPWGNTLTNQFASGVKWIWSSDANNHNKVYFWTKYNPGQNALIKATADNQIEVYKNGDIIGSGNDWTKVKYIPAHLEAGDIVGLYGTDSTEAGDRGGILSEILFRDNQGNIKSLVTDPGWKYTTTFVSGWADQEMDDSNWPSAVSYGQRGVAPWGNTGTIAGISSLAHWIWSSLPVDDNDVWMRKEIPNASLTITCDNQCEVYVNGILKGTVTTWTSPQTIGLNLSNTDVLAIKGIDQGGVAGIVASLNYNNAIVVTNNSWKASSQLQAGWNTDDFDDSGWARAKSYGSNGVMPWNTVSGIASQAQWIWTNDRYNDDIVYLRYTIGQSNTGTGLTTLTASADDGFSLYWNGELLMTGNNWRQGKQTFLELSSNDVIAAEGNDSGYKAGFILESTGSFTINTNTSWKILSTSSAPAGWNTVSFNDTAWVNATSYGQYGASPWGKNIAGFTINSTAQWIWSNKNTTGSSTNDKKVLFRKKI